MLRINQKKRRLSIMKMTYDKKVDYLELFFVEDLPNGYYEDSELSDGTTYVFKEMETDEIVGYGIINAFKNLKDALLLTPSQKVAAYSWMIRKKKGFTQEQLARAISSELESFSSKKIQRIENCDVTASVNYPIELHKLEPSFELNFIMSKHKAAI